MCMNLRTARCCDDQITQKVVQMVFVQCSEHVLYMVSQMIHESEITFTDSMQFFF